MIKAKLQPLPTILERKYGFDEFNDWFFAGGARRLGNGLWLWGDKTVIDGIMVNGTAKLIGWFAGVARRVQTGYIYHYAFTMIIGVFAMLTFFWLYLHRSDTGTITTTMFQGYVISLAIWVPIAFGIAVLAIGNDKHAAPARWTALVGSILGLAVCVPLWTGFQLVARRCSSSRWRRGSRAST